MKILAIDQDCLISYLNLYFDEIAEIILLSTFYLSRLFKILDNSRIPSFLISQIRILSCVSYRSRPRSYYKPSILHACRSIRFTLSLVSSPRISFRIVSFDLKLLCKTFAKFPIFVWNTSHERALLNLSVNPILVILKVWGLLRDRGSIDDTRVMKGW